jgi:hypothetical protein
MSLIFLTLGTFSVNAAVLLTETFESVTNIIDQNGQSQMAPALGETTFVNGVIIPSRTPQIVNNAFFTGSNGTNWKVASLFGSGSGALNYSGVNTPNLSTAFDLSLRNRQQSPLSANLITEVASAYLGPSIFTLEFDYVSTGVRPISFDINVRNSTRLLGDTAYTATLPTGSVFGNSGVPVLVSGHYVGTWTSAVSSPTIALEFNGNFASNVSLDNVLLTQVSVVPEPSEWAMLLGGLSTVAALVRRRKSLQARA